MAIQAILDPVIEAARQELATRLPAPTYRVFRTETIARREVGDEELFTPPQGQRGIEGIIYQREGGAFFTSWGDSDAAGNTIAGAATGLVENNNITWVEFRYAPSGQPMGEAVWVRIDPTWKIDTMQCWIARRADNPARADLVVFLTTHSVGLPRRYIAWEVVVIPNCWAYTVEQEIFSRGGIGTFRGQLVEPEPNPTITPGEIVAAIADALAPNVNTSLKRNLFTLMGAALLDTLYSEAADPIVLDEGELDQRIRTMTAGTMDLYSSPGLFKRLDETLYGTGHKVLRERGLGHEPDPGKPEATVTVEEEEEVVVPLAPEPDQEAKP